MKKLIDNTYLHAVGRCLDKEAMNLGDVTTFIRFVGEILVADEIFFTAIKDGPVYPLSKKSADRVNNFLEETLIKYKPRSEFDDDSISSKIVDELPFEIELIDLKRDISVSRLEPEFKYGQNPDISLHPWLVQPSEDNYEKINPHSRRIADVLKHPRVMDAIQKLKKQSSQWNFFFTIALASSIRMLFYENMSRDLDSEYLPSDGRARLHKLSKSARAESLVNLYEKLDFKQNQLSKYSLKSLVLSLVVVGNEDPVKITREAVNLREETLPLQPSLESPLSGDSVNKTSSRLKGLIERMLKVEWGEEPPPSFTKIFQPQLVFPGVPAVAVDLQELREWIEYKREKRKYKAVYETVLARKNTKLERSIEKLRFNCGVKK